MLSRREFTFGTASIASLAFAPDISAIFNEEDEKWIKAASDVKLQQKILDDSLKSDKDAGAVIKRYYNVEVVELSEDEQKKSRDKYALVRDKLALKFTDSSAEKDFKETLKQQSKVYAVAMEKETKEMEESAYQYFVAQIIDRAKDAKDAFVYLAPEIWGRKTPAIGIVIPEFWKESSYKTAKDRKSTLHHHLAQRAKDMYDVIRLNELWKGTSNKNPVNIIYTKGAFWQSLKDEFIGIMISRGYFAQYEQSEAKKCELSPERLKKIAEVWENCPEFQCIVKNEKGRREAHGALGEAMDDMGFKCLPWKGAIIPYDAKKVMEYKFEKK